MELEAGGDTLPQTRCANDLKTLGFLPEGVGLKPACPMLRPIAKRTLASKLQLTLAGDQHDGAGKLAVRDVLPERVMDADARMRATG